MDDELTKLEAELKRLRPAPAVALERRVVRELDASRAPRPLLHRLAWALPAAAAIAVLLALEVRRESRMIVSEQELQVAFKPVAAEDVLLSSQDEGLVTLADGTPARRLRQMFVDTITWQNPRTNAYVKWSIPREEVQVVPVVYQ